MKKVIKAESFVGIIIGVFILSFILLGIWNLMFHSRDVIVSYQRVQKADVLKANIANIIKGIDTDNIKENEVFYIYKNSGTNHFEAFTGTLNAWYKYINEYGANINVNTYQWDVYARTLWKERDDRSLESENQIIRVSIRKLVKK